MNFLLIDERKDFCGVFWEEGQLITAFETVSSIPFAACTISTDEMAAFRENIAVLWRRITAHTLDHVVLCDLKYRKWFRKLLKKTYEVKDSHDHSYFLSFFFSSFFSSFFYSSIANCRALCSSSSSSLPAALAPAFCRAAACLCSSSWRLSWRAIMNSGS